MPNLSNEEIRVSSVFIPAQESGYIDYASAEDSVYSEPARTQPSPRTLAFSQRASEELPVWSIDDINNLYQPPRIGLSRIIKYKEPDLIYKNNDDLLYYSRIHLKETDTYQVVVGFGEVVMFKESFKTKRSADDALNTEVVKLNTMKSSRW